MSRILAGIPAYEEAKTIGSIVLETKKYVDEVVVIDDGSSDNTSWIAQQAGATVIRHPSNRGYGAALRTCFSYARNNGTQVLVILDADGQHRPEWIPRVMEPVLSTEVDIAIGSRFLEDEGVKKVPLYRRFGIKVLTKLTNLGTRDGGEVRDAQSGFRAYSRRAVDVLDPREPDMGASTEILWDADRQGLRISEVPIVTDYDVEGSTQGPVRHALGVIGAMVRYVETEHALLTFALPGVLLTLFALVLGMNVVDRYYATSPHELALGLTLITVLIGVLGMMMCFVGLILHAILNAQRRTA